MKKLLTLALAMILALGLAACFGNGGNTETPTTTESTPTEADITTIAGYEPAPTDPAFDAEELFKRLEGYWNTPRFALEGIPYGFASFEYSEHNDGKPCLYTGVYESEGTSFGELVGGRGIGENTATLNFWSPASEDGLWGERPEMIETISLDLSGLEEGSIRIKRDCPIWSVDWITYTYGGETFGEAEQKAFHMIGLFQRLEGCWNENDGGRLFVAFEYEEGQPSLYYGHYDSGFGVNGQLTGGKSTGTDMAELTFLSPALGDVNEDGDHPEMTVTVLLDMTNLERDGKINMRIESDSSEYGSINWCTVIYSGKTVDEAYAKWNELH